MPEWLLGSELLLFYDPAFTKKTECKSMKGPKLEFLIKELEDRDDMTVAEFDGVLNALAFLLPMKLLKGVTADQIATTDGAVLVVGNAFPNWSVHIQGRANNKDGHWRCTLRENDSRDNDAVIGLGRSPALSQAILAATLRLSILQKGKNIPD